MYTSSYTYEVIRNIISLNTDLQRKLYITIAIINFLRAEKLNYGKLSRMYHSLKSLVQTPSQNWTGTLPNYSLQKIHQNRRNLELKPKIGKIKFNTVPLNLLHSSFLIKINFRQYIAGKINF